jgi:hypothetical protein
VYLSYLGILLDNEMLLVIEICYLSEVFGQLDRVIVEKIIL